MTTSHRTPSQVAQILFLFFHMPLGTEKNPKKGRFRLSKKTFRRIAGRKDLRDAFIQEVVGESYDLGLILSYVGGDYFFVCSEESLEDSRSVTYKSFKNRYINDSTSEENEISKLYKKTSQRLRKSDDDDE